MKSHPIRPIRAVPQEARYWAVSVSGRRCGGRRWTESPAEWQPRPSLTFHQSIESISSGSQVTSFLPACTRRRCARDNEHEWGGGEGGGETYHSRCSGKREKPISTCPAPVGPPRLCLLCLLRPVPPRLSLVSAWAKVKHLPPSSGERSDPHF